jgi:hypothetical protein
VPAWFNDLLGEAVADFGDMRRLINGVPARRAQLAVAFEGAEHAATAASRRHAPFAASVSDAGDELGEVSRSTSEGTAMRVIDYAFASKLVDRVQFAQLDELRELRHQVNYPADMIEPSRKEVTQFEGLVDEVLKLAATRLPTPKIPPPPSIGSEPHVG